MVTGTDGIAKLSFKYLNKVSCARSAIDGAAYYSSLANGGFNRGHSLVSDKRVITLIKKKML